MVQFYIDNGFRPIPIHGINTPCSCDIKEPDPWKTNQCVGKKPIPEHWPDKHYTVDDFPDDSNVALAMGKQLDGRWFVGFDVDGQLDINQFFFELPETLECKTGRGRHLIYEVKPDSPLGNWNDILSTRAETGYKEGFNGALDIKYARGAMVSPPSFHRFGEQYKWVKWQQPTYLDYGTVVDLVRFRRKAFPNAKRYPRWGADPLHIGKKP